jgi:hypothetical protein
MRKSAVAVAIAVIASGLLAVPAPAAPGFEPDPSWQANNMVRALRFGPGAIYLGGAFTRMRPAGAAPGAGEVVRNGAAAVSRTTGDLLAWNPNVQGTVFAIAISGSTVYLGGSFTSVRTQTRTNLAAVNATTGAILPWNPTTNGPVRELEIGPNGSIFIGGSFTRVSGASRQRIAEIRPNGTVAPFHTNIGQIDGLCPPRCSPVVFTIDFSTDGDTVFFGGHFGTVNGVGRNEVAAVPIGNGAQTLPWDPDVYADQNCPTCQPAETHRVYNMIVTSDKVYMCGGFWRVWHGTRRAYNVLVTNLTTGQPDPNFQAGDDGDTTGCDLRGGILYLGGHFNYVGRKCSQNPGGASGTCFEDPASTVRHHVAAVDAQTGRILAWDPTANAHTGVWTIAATTTTAAFGGHFTRMGGRASQHFARYVTNLPTL